MTAGVTREELREVLANADCLHDAAAIQDAVRRLAAAINPQYRDRCPLVLVVMNGGLLPAGWLLPAFDFFFELDYVHATRYRGRTSGDKLQWLAKPHKSLQGRDVLLVDDILDEGVTLRELIAWCGEEGANSVRTAVLVQKDIGRPASAKADFVGLVVENRYVFGCGMDYKEHFRHLPALYALGRK
ncbi:MAG TPA: hypoxanthine-guanine phosphoribosyltransferase [Gammaproteobacteria bacterium]